MPPSSSPARQAPPHNKRCADALTNAIETLSITACKRCKESQLPLRYWKRAKPSFSNAPQVLREKAKNRKLSVPFRSHPFEVAVEVRAPRKVKQQSAVQPSCFVRPLECCRVLARTPPCPDLGRCRRHSVCKSGRDLLGSATPPRTFGITQHAPACRAVVSQRPGESRGHARNPATQTWQSLAVS